MKIRSFTGLFLAGWLLVLSGCWPTAAWAYKTSAAGNPIVPVRLSKTVVQAEVVSTMDKIYLGLGGRQHLAPGTGMLFIMPTLELQHFCMRGMLIPIDIIWIAHDRIIGFHKDLSPKDPGTFISPAPADSVLEVPAGFVESAGLRIGDRVQSRR